MSQCAICGGDTPLPKQRGQAPKYCSDECRRKARRDQRLQFVADHPDLARERNRINVTKWRKTKPESFRSGKRRNYAARRDEITEYKRKRRASDPDGFRAYARNHYAANKERIRERDRKRRAKEHIRARARMLAAKWRVENYERARESGRQYQRTHPEVFRKGSQTRRARMVGAFVENVDPRVVFDRDKGICGICLKDVDPASKWEVDHVMPISRGGAHSYSNVQLAHRKCNRAKSASLPDGQSTRRLHAGDPLAHLSRSPPSLR